MIKNFSLGFSLSLLSRTLAYKAHISGIFGQSYGFHGPIKCPKKYYFGD